jgi:hypothetical protein
LTQKDKTGIIKKQEVGKGCPDRHFQARNFRDVDKGGGAYFLTPI